MDISHALIRRARSAIAANQRGRALMMMRNLITENPAIGSAWRQVALLCGELKDFGATAQAYRLLLESGHDAERDRLGLCQYLLRTGATDELETMIKSMLERDPDSPNAVYTSGVLYNVTARPDQAMESFRRAYELDPSRTTAWGAIMNLKTIEDGDDPDLKGVQSLSERLERDGAPLDQRMPLTYALANAYDKLGRYDEAFEKYELGARQNMTLHDGAKIDKSAYFTRLMEIFDEDQLAGAEGAEHDRPIFVIGPPRSGTTLTESILVAHSQVINGAEMSHLHCATYPAQSVIQADRRDINAALEERLGPQPWRQMGNLYMLLANERMGETDRFVDSSAALYQQAGFILSALPKAKIIWLSRDIRDSLWSIFKMRFETGQYYTYDFKTIHDHLSWGRRFRDYFAERAPDQVLRVQYEDLASDPDHWIRKILQFCDLEYEDSVSRFHEAKRQVATASSQQIRKPISTRSIGSWKRYQTHLDPIYRRLLGDDYETADNADLLERAN